MTLPLYAAIDALTAEVAERDIELALLKSRYQALERLSAIAEQDCSCAPDPQSGEVPNLCKSCMAARVLDKVFEEAGQALKEECR
jgi:hypothetical protein